MTNALFRDTTVAVRRELDRQYEARIQAAGKLQELRPLFKRRVGRVAAGATLTASGLLLFVGAVVGQWLDLLPQRVAGPFGLLTLCWLAAWPVALGAGLAGRVLGAWRFDATDESRGTGRRLRAALGDDPFLALVRLRATPAPAESLGARLRRLEVASFALPMIGCSLLLPLTLHTLFLILTRGLGAGGSGHTDFPFPPDLECCDSWITVSVVIVGHAHLVLAGNAWLYARRLARETDLSLPRSDGWIALAWTVLASAIPGAILWLVPPTIAVATGTAFIPAMYARARTIARRERATLDGTALLGAPGPTAVLSPAATPAAGPRGREDERDERSGPRPAPRS